MFRMHDHSPPVSLAPDMRAADENDSEWAAKQHERKKRQEEEEIRARIDAEMLKGETARQRMSNVCGVLPSRVQKLDDSKKKQGALHCFLTDPREFGNLSDHGLQNTRRCWTSRGWESRSKTRSRSFNLLRERQRRRRAARTRTRMQAARARVRRRRSARRNTSMRPSSGRDAKVEGGEVVASVGQRGRGTLIPAATANRRRRSGKKIRRRNRRKRSRERIRNKRSPFAAKTFKAAAERALCTHTLCWSGCRSRKRRK